MPEKKPPFTDYGVIEVPLEEAKKIDSFKHNNLINVEVSKNFYKQYLTEKWVLDGDKIVYNYNLDKKAIYEHWKNSGCPTDKLA